eukprot:SAG31_NODE_1670_length_7567_cov_13.084360_4_plen_98_part_00
MLPLWRQLAAPCRAQTAWAVTSTHQDVEASIVPNNNEGDEPKEEGSQNEMEVVLRARNGQAPTSRSFFLILYDDQFRYATIVSAHLQCSLVAWDAQN